MATELSRRISRDRSDKHYGKGMTAVMADYDGDGFMDIFVTNDTCRNFLFTISAARIHEVAMEQGVAYPESAKAIPAWAPIKTCTTTASPISGTPHRKTNLPSLPYRGNDSGGHLQEPPFFPNPDHVRWSNGIFDFDNDAGRICSSPAATCSIMSRFTHPQIRGTNTVFRNLGNGTFQT